MINGDVVLIYGGVTLVPGVVNLYTVL
jgi:hypothetical protein